MFLPFVAWSPDRDVLDSPYDALSSSFKFVCLKPRKFRNSFLCRSSKPSSERREMNPRELSSLWITCWFGGFWDAGPLSRGLCVRPSVRLSPGPLLLFIQNFIRGIASTLSVRSPWQIFLDFRWRNLVKYRFHPKKTKKKVNSLCLHFDYEAYWFPRTRRCQTVDELVKN